MNMTLDGFCDHTSMGADEEIHQHYGDLILGAGTLVYGRATYQLMESYWPSVVKNPTGNKPMDDFAVAINNVHKVVFSRTLKGVEWKNTELRREVSREEIQALKESGKGDIFVGSPGMIAALTRLNLFDEYQICVHPVIAGSGLILFKDITDKITLTLKKTKTFGGGAVALYYEPAKM